MGDVVTNEEQALIKAGRANTSRQDTSGKCNLLNKEKVLYFKNCMLEDKKRRWKTRLSDGPGLTLFGAFETLLPSTLPILSRVSGSLGCLIDSTREEKE